MSSIVTAPVELPAERPAPGALGLAERGLLPDALVRLGIRRLCTARLRAERNGGPDAEAARFAERIDALRTSPVAIHTDAANTQHYELPPAFFEQCLGPHLKYSCCYFPNGNETLAEAEQAMLELSAQRAELGDGQDILELGCGWGAMTLWMAEHFPSSRITAVSNSHAQRRHIEMRCNALGVGNVRILTQDINSLFLEERHFDRCVSVEMLEHVRNYEVLLHRIASWLKPGGKLFAHMFAHRTLMYPFETVGEDNWMGRHFFTGGLMPSVDTLLHFQDALALERRWLIDGTHYRRTANLWLARQDEHRVEALGALRGVHGENAGLWLQRWRLFWLACAELFGYAHGTEWLIAHYRFTRPARGSIV